MEKIWFVDLRGFMTETNFIKFFPSSDMTFTEQMNALMRFSIYFALIMFMLKKDSNILFVPIFMGLFTYLVYNVDEKNKMHEKMLLDRVGLTEEHMSKKLCQKPTRHNPFMNVLVSDYSTNPQRPRACKFEGAVKDEIKQQFDVNLYRDVDDIFHKKASDRQFYTTPSTTIPNDASSYAKWLYGTKRTCKEGNGGKCYANMFRMTNV